MPGIDSGHSSDPFGTTHWSVVLAAGDEHSDVAQTALEQLCQSYWYPVYAYVRRRCGNVHDAQDLTQAFFAQLLERHAISQADPSRGKFRAFLLTSARNFLINEHKKAAAKKRGGDRKQLSLDFVAAERRFTLEASDGVTPERLFERQWALTLLNRVLDSLQQEYSTAGKRDLFDELKVLLTGQTTAATHAIMAAKLGISEGASRAALLRLRNQFRERLIVEIEQTVTRSDEVEQELHSLLAVVGA